MKKKKKTKWAGKYTVVEKAANQLKLNEMTTPRTSGRYKGVSVGRDKDGFFVTTHRARSKSYLTLAKIPDAKIKWVESTG